MKSNPYTDRIGTYRWIEQQRQSPIRARSWRWWVANDELGLIVRQGSSSTVSSDKKSKAPMHKNWILG